MIWVFFSPTKLFEDIKEGRARWWHAWIWLCVIFLIVGYASIPINIAVVEINPRDLPPEQLDHQLEFLEGPGKWIQVGAAPVMVLVMSLIVSALVYVLVSILSDKANFKKFFTLSLFTSIVSSMTYVVGTVVVRLKGVDAIRSAADARFSLGLGFLAPEEGALARALLTSFDFFAIWSFVLIVMGLMHIFDMPRRHAIYCIIPMYIISVGMLLLGEVTGSFG